MKFEFINYIDKKCKDENFPPEFKAIDLINMLKMRIEQMLNIYLKNSDIISYELFKTSKLSIYESNLYNKDCPYIINYTTLSTSQWNDRILNKIKNTIEYITTNNYIDSSKINILEFYTTSNIWFSKNTILDSQVIEYYNKGFGMTQISSIIVFMSKLKLISSNILYTEKEYLKRYYNFILNLYDLYKNVFNSVDYILKLSPNHISLLKQFKAFESLHINKIAKTGKVMKDFDYIMDNSPKITKDIIVWRGIKVNNIDDFRINDTTIKSVTLNPLKAKEFTKEYSCCLLRITVTSGSQMLYLDEGNLNSPNTTEFEFILPRFISFSKPIWNNDLKCYDVNTINNDDKKITHVLKKQKIDVDTTLKNTTNDLFNKLNSRFKLN